MQRESNVGLRTGNGFKRRHYRRLREIVADVRAILRRRNQMRELMRGETLSAQFRERLMLVVTEVNACRYCSYYHAKQALVEGLSAEEIQALTQGEFEASPPEERPAMLYAQHWAEADGEPDPAAWERLVALYGRKHAEAIDLALRVIRVGNLSGNTFDYLLYLISFGRLGA